MVLLTISVFLELLLRNKLLIIGEGKISGICGSPGQIPVFISPFKLITSDTADIDTIHPLAHIN